MKNSILQLLTAYVDGELRPRQRKAVERLLRKSPEARRFLRNLQADQNALQDLPRVRLGSTFAEEILGQLKPRSVKIYRTSAWSYRTVAIASVAAAIVMAIGLGTYLLLADLAARRQAGGHLALQTQPHGVKSVVPKHPPLGEVPSSDAPPREDVAPKADDLGRLASGFELLVEPFTSGARQLLPDQPPGLALLRGGGSEARPEGDAPFTHQPVLTAPPATATSAFKSIDLKLALFLDPRNLESAKLTERLKQDPFHHIDIACLESWKSFERLQLACKQAGVRLVVDPEVTARLNKKVPAAYMLYLENTTPEQVVKLLEALQAEEKKAEAKRKGDGQLDSLMVQPLDEQGRKRLAESLGLTTLTPAAPSAPRSSAQPDPTRPLSDDTLKSLERLTTGQGPKPASGEPTALALVYYANRTRMTPSREHRQFLEARKAPAPQSIHVVLFLRPSRG